MTKSKIPKFKRTMTITLSCSCGYELSRKTSARELDADAAELESELWEHNDQHMAEIHQGSLAEAEDEFDLSCKCGWGAKFRSFGRSLKHGAERILELHCQGSTDSQIKKKFYYFYPRALK